MCRKIFTLYVLIILPLAGRLPTQVICSVVYHLFQPILLISVFFVRQTPNSLPLGSVNPLFSCLSFRVSFSNVEHQLSIAIMSTTVSDCLMVGCRRLIGTYLNWSRLKRKWLREGSRNRTIVESAHARARPGIPQVRYPAAGISSLVLQRIVRLPWNHSLL